jgi:monothiol glutaredoxin
MTDQSLAEQVRTLIAENHVMLFMKGTPDVPRCGFSARTVQILDSLGVDYGAVDVLPALQPLREVTRDLADWTTFPQLYVGGQLVGGADICMEMYESGELAGLLGVEQAQLDAPVAEAAGPAPIQIEGA